MLCPSCGSPMRDGKCRLCEGLLATSDKESLYDTAEERRLGKRLERDGKPRREVGDIAETVSLEDHLREQMRSVLDADGQKIADYLIANIDERGLLECELEEVGRETKSDLSEVKKALAALQAADPLGVGAKSPQEALLLQVQHMAREGEQVDPWAAEILEHCWEDLAYQRYQRIARSVRCTIEQARQAADYIRDNLNPYPASAFSARGSMESQAIRWPDIVIYRERDDYIVEIVESYESELRISETFLRLRRVLGANNRSGKKTAALDSLRRASFFLACLKMRRRTLQEVAECVVRMQRGYLDTGAEQHLRPLTRAKVASLLGKHESTVSRAVADKLVLMPDRRLIPFERFFSPSAAPKSVILELIHQERHGKPLTDLQISRILESRGYRVARRTVAKYRQALKIPPSTQRRAR